MAESKSRIVVELGAQDTSQKAFNSFNRSVVRTQQTVSASNKHFRQWRGMMGQMGHQVQDVAVQMQSGTNAAIIFAQQGGQIASLIGPWGAVAGAAIAIGGALASAIGVMGNAKTALRDLEAAQEAVNEVMQKGAINEATKEYAELAKVSEGLAKIKLASAIHDLESASKSARTELMELLGGNSRLAREAKVARENFSNMIDKESASAAMQFLQDRLTGFTQRFGAAGQEMQGIVDNLFSAETSADIASVIDELAGIRSTNEEFIEARNSSVALAESLYNTMKQLERLNAGMAEYGTADRLKARIDAMAEEDALVGQGLAEAAKRSQKAIDDEIDRQKAARDARIDLLVDQENAVMAGYADAAAASQAALDAEADRQKAARDAQIDAMADQDALVMTGYQDAIDARKKAAEEAYAQRQKELQAEYDLEAQYIEAGQEAHRQNLMTQLQARKDYDAAVKAMDMAALDSLGSFFGSMAAQMEEGSDAYKAMFLLQKGINIASIVMNAQTAAMAALAPPPIGYGPILGEAMAAKIYTQAAMSAGLVAGQTLASFEGGGITFNGIRAGGMDGKGGRLAVVHPNEKITDLEKEGAGGQPVNVNVNIQAIDTQSGMEFIMKNRDILTNAVSRSMNNRGRRL